jgi:hypothetical protein
MKFPSSFVSLSPMTTRPVILSLTLSLSLSGCLFGNSDESEGPSGYLKSSEPYVQVGNSIALQSKGLDTIRWCDGDKLLSETHPRFEGDTLRFELKQDSLFIIHFVRYYIGDAGMENYSIYVKKSGGPALEGTWSWKGDAFRLVHNSLIPDEKAYYDSLTEASRAEALAYPVTLEFTGTLFKTFATKTLADEFLEAWSKQDGFGIPAWFDTDYYDLTLSKRDGNTIEIKGANTGSAYVRLTINAAGDITFTGSDPENAPETAYANPTSCPNGRIPDWILDFLGENFRDELPI